MAITKELIEQKIQSLTQQRQEIAQNMQRLNIEDNACAGAIAVLENLLAELDTESAD